MTNESPRRRVVAIVGPTASGKSALAAELCRQWNGEVVSFDSMQVYCGMPIGTAQPTEAERRGVSHHLIGCISPHMPFSCAEYVTLANQTITAVTERGRLPVLCGGTGLYLERLLHGGSFEEVPGGDPKFRAEMQGIAEREGVERVHKILRDMDPESADAIHPNNLKRVIRALEIFWLTGKTKTEWDLASKQGPSVYDATLIGLRFDNRERLYERIHRRVDEMLRNGLVEETKKLLVDGVFEANATAAQAIGYKELLPYLSGETSLLEAIQAVQLATRHYAKRQMTWFSANPEVRWITVDRDGVERSLEELLAEASEILRANGFVLPEKRE